MKWIDRAERIFGHLAIPHLIRIVSAFNALVFVLYKLNPSFPRWLTLNPEAVKHGQVWRLVSYVFVPNLFGGPITDWLLVAFYILYLWWIGEGLEEAMGSFRVNLFYLLGVAATTVAAFLAPGPDVGVAVLNLSLLFAFAHFYPEATVYMLGIVPVKVKWLAWFSGAMAGLRLLVWPWSYRFAVAASVVNYLLFFGPEIWRAYLHGRDVTVRRERFARAQLPEDQALHRCAVCGRTEQSAPELEFRVARDGEEYCREHLPKPANAGEAG